MNQQTPPHTPAAIQGTTKHRFSRIESGTRTRWRLTHQAETAKTQAYATANAKATPTIFQMRSHHRLVPTCTTIAAPKIAAHTAGLVEAVMIAVYGMVT